MEKQTAFQPGDIPSRAVSPCWSLTMQGGKGGACGQSLTCSQPGLGHPMPLHPAVHPSPGQHSLATATAAAQLQRQRWKKAPGLRRVQAGLCAVSDP